MRDKRVWLEEKTDFFDDKDFRQYDKHHSPADPPEEQTDFWSDKSTRHYDQRGRKASWFEEQINFWGDKSTQHCVSNQKSYSHIGLTPPQPISEDLIKPVSISHTIDIAKPQLVYDVF